MLPLSCGAIFFLIRSLCYERKMQPPLSSTTLVYAFDFGILTKNDGKIDLRTMSCCPVNTVQEGASHDVPQSLQKSLYSDILMFHHPAYAINLPVFSSYSPYFHTTSLAVNCYILYQLSFISHFRIPEYMFQMAYGKQGNRRSWCCPCWPSADLSERPNSGKFQTHGLLSGGVNN